MNNHKYIIKRVVLNYKDRKYGTQSNAYFNVNLPSAYSGDNGNNKSLVFVDSLFINNDLDWTLEMNNFNLHIKELVQPNSFSTATNNMADIIMTTNSTINENLPTHKSFPIPVENDFFQNKMLNVYLTSPTVSFGESLEFPPVALNGDLTTLSNQSYGNGLYTTISTSRSAGFPYQIFNKTYEGYPLVTSFSSNNLYNNSTGWYEGWSSNFTNMSGSNYYGEYITIQMPTSIKLNSYSHTTNIEYNNRNINTYVLGGSTDGSIWYLIDSRSNMFWTSSNQTSNIPVPSGNSNYYNYYRLLCQRVGNSNITNYRNGWGISELRLYGEPLYFTDYSITLNIVNQ